jgi:transcriptional regulator with XRE-family HTH domain
MNDERAATSVDLQIGLRLRARRREIGLSQEALAQRLGVTFQQVQKYEKGVNRLAAGRLLAIARIVEIPVQYFYEGLLDEAAKDAGGIADFIAAMRNSEAQALVIAFSRISDPKVRRHLVALVTAFSGSGEESVESMIGDAAA